MEDRHPFLVPSRLRQFELENYLLDNMCLFVREKSYPKSRYRSPHCGKKLTVVGGLFSGHISLL